MIFDTLVRSTHFCKLLNRKLQDKSSVLCSYHSCFHLILSGRERQRNQVNYWSCQSHTVYYGMPYGIASPTAFHSLHTTCLTCTVSIPYRYPIDFQFQPTYIPREACMSSDDCVNWPFYSYFMHTLSAPHCKHLLDIGICLTALSHYVLAAPVATV